jgi:hypothetical protein
LSLIALLRNGCWVFSVASKNIDQKVAFSIVDFVIGNFVIGNLSFILSFLISLVVGINKLFASHIGIFGNTGSGKSYTLTKIYRQLFKEYKGNEKFKNNAKLDFVIGNFVIGNLSFILSFLISLVVKL